MKRSVHLTRMIIEGISRYSPYKGTKLGYVREYDTNPTIVTDLTTKMDIQRAIKILYKRKELSDQEILMLSYVILDGRLSRRDISKLIEKDSGFYINQRTVSRRLESAYIKIARFLGFEYGDGRIFKMVARQLGRPAPYLLNEDEIDKIIQIMEKV